MRFVPVALLSLAWASGALAQVPASARLTAPRASALDTTLLAIEDGRPVDHAAVQALVQAVAGGSPDIQRQAVRALGRLERPDLIPHLLARLSSPLPELRAEAANAIGQAAQGFRTPPAATFPARPAGMDQGVRAASAPLLARLAIETDPGVRGVLVATLGRLPYRSAEEVRQIETRLVDAASNTLVPRDAPIDLAPQVLGAVKGLEALFRLHGRLAAPRPETVERLRQLVVSDLRVRDSVAAAEAPQTVPARTETPFSGFATSARVRIKRLALAMLVSREAADLETLRAVLTDERADGELRRLATLGAGNLDAADAGDLITRFFRGVKGLSLHPYEALRGYARRHRTGSCEPFVRAIEGGESAALRLLAIDLLAGPCPDAEREAVTTALERQADRLVGVAGVASEPASGGGRRHDDVSWHYPAHAIVSLASVDAARAAARLDRFADHPTWQVRMYAARAAAVLGDGESLGRLARDDHDNVREAAVDGLVRVRGHEADEVYIDALGRADYQLVRTAAGALAGTDRRQEAVPALVAALARLTAERRDTSRDPRMAILDRLGELGAADDAPAVAGSLQDFDPRVASRAAALLTAWTGVEQKPSPQALAAPALPDRAELARLDGSTARITMKGGAGFTLRLLPGEAPVTTWRFVQLAETGYFNGLTFHRVVPYFVIQGGSPGANEYMGDGPYLRDELGLRPHLAGSVGISTRGRDTGDAQIFVDLVDNPRLDHNYTVFAEVVTGMDVVQAILEGDVIERVEIVRR